MNLKTSFRLLTRAGPIARAVLDGLGHRGELALLELTAVRDRALAMAALGVGATILVLLAGMAATFAFAAAVWHLPNRGLLLVILTGVELLGAALCLALASRSLRDWQPFAATLRQLEEDKTCLRDLLPPEKPEPEAPRP